jgi:Zn-dependent oligopeptidase
VRKTQYDFDSQQMRPYLPYDAVKQGVLDLSAKLFGVEFRPVKGAPVWHPSVECYEMFENGKLMGRFYLTCTRATTNTTTPRSSTSAAGCWTGRSPRPRSCATCRR